MKYFSYIYFAGLAKKNFFGLLFYPLTISQFIHLFFLHPFFVHFMPLFGPLGWQGIPQLY